MASPTTIVENTRILVAENCHVDFTNPCTAKSKIRGFAPDIIQELILKKTIQVSLRGAAFYRGTLDGIPVVAKIVFGHDIAKLNLRKEVKNYFEMEELQETIIPIGIPNSITTLKDQLQ